MRHLNILTLIFGFMLAGCSTYVDAITTSNSKYGADKMGPPGQALTSASATPPANSMGVKGTINARDADSLYKSLDAMVGSLSQKEQLAFMEAFFRVAYLDRCDIDGKYGKTSNAITGGRKSFSGCKSSAKNVVWHGAEAEAYVADKRMDNNPAYVASNGFGSWTGGETQRGSYVKFISTYGDFVDGKSADYILQRNKDIMNGNAVSFRKK